MSKNHYTDLMDQIYVGKDFYRKTVEKIQQASFHYVPPVEKKPFRRCIILGASIVFIVIITQTIYLGISQIQENPFFMGGGSQATIETAQIPVLEWEGRRYQLQGGEISSESVGGYLGTGQLLGKQSPLFRKEGESPLLWVTAPLVSEEEYYSYQFAGFVSPDHTLLDVIQLYEGACGPLTSISCVQDGECGPDSTSVPLPYTNSSGEIQVIRSSFATCFPDSSLSTGTETLSSDSSTYFYQIETEGKELTFTFFNGVSCSLSLYQGNSVGSGFGYLYPIPESIQSWLSS